MTDVPGPQGLKSWQDAFQYPVPTIRRLEQELRRDVENNKEKLRALVGTRYRDLVGTAETIISMNHGIQQVESSMTDIGCRCNPRLAEGKHSHSNETNDDGLVKSVSSDQIMDKYSFDAQLILLHRCTASVSRTLRKRGSPLLVAKLLVICRLLYKVLSQSNHLPPFLEDLRTQAALLRRKLLKRVNKRLSLANTPAEDVIEALVAYCLTTGSSSDAGVRHFHQLRLESIKSRLEGNTTDEDVTKALVLYIQTIQTSKVVLSRRLSDIIASLKMQPLLSDPEVCALDTLSVDVLGRWVSADIRSFTPWLKLTEFSKQEAEKMIGQWSNLAFAAFIHGCEKNLADWVELSDVLLLRKKTLDMWIDSSNSNIVGSSLNVVDDIRTVFSKQLTRILEDQARGLKFVGQQISSTVSEWEGKDHTSVQPLWDRDLSSMDYSNGAVDFKQAVIDRLLGRDDDVLAVIESYQSWLSSIEKSRGLVDEMRGLRWAEVLDEDEESLGVHMKAALNEDDPQLLLEILQHAVQEAFNSLQASFSEIYLKLGTSNQKDKAAFILRLVRHIRAEVPATLTSPDFVLSVDVVPKLQNILATEVITRAGRLEISTNSNSVPGRTLWEGEPELPGQPSPSAFRFLRGLMDIMDQCGPDLWDTSTVQTLKLALRENTAASISLALGEVKIPSPVEEDISGSESERQGRELTRKPEESPVSSTEPSRQEKHGDPRDWKLQLYFDAVYLHNAFALKTVSGEQGQLTDALDKTRGVLGSDIQEEAVFIEESAMDYWERTKLLFGLLSTDLTN